MSPVPCDVIRDYVFEVTPGKSVVNIIIYPESLLLFSLNCPVPGMYPGNLIEGV
jgi:hypothetical protein